LNPVQSVRFDAGRSARLAEVRSRSDLAPALRGLGLEPPLPVLVLVGGADGLDAAVARRLEGLFRDALAPLLEGLGAAVIDGGTDAGVMGLIGRARTRAQGRFPLLGVAPSAKIALPAGASRDAGGHTPLEPNHSHFLLVPGADWADGAPWISSAAGALCGGMPSATLVAGGGEVTRLDLGLSLQAGRPALLLAGSGGAADAAAAALGAEDLAAIGAPPDAARLLRALEMDSAEGDLPGILGSLLR
jgi:hypothetical protein